MAISSISSARSAAVRPTITRADFTHYVHTVRKGETLTSIARRFGTTAALLAMDNAIANPDRILVGQRLGVAGWYQYTLRPGDTLYRLSQASGMTVEGIASFNGISNPARVAAGTTLVFQAP